MLYSLCTDLIYLYKLLEIFLFTKGCNCKQHFEELQKLLLMLTPFSYVLSATFLPLPPMLINVILNFVLISIKA